MVEMEPEKLTGKPKPLPKTNGRLGVGRLLHHFSPATKAKDFVPPFQWTSREEEDRSRMIHLGRP